MSTVSCVDCGRLRVHMSILQIFNLLEIKETLRRSDRAQESKYHIASAAAADSMDGTRPYTEKDISIVEQFSRRKNLGDRGGVE